jgi:unsaturated rhamnogalacturonyl hydrolase
MNKSQNFQRRDFLKTAATGIIATTGAGAFISGTAIENNTTQPVDLIQKVKTALLSMQRASWEQGVSMQAMWESGDFEMAYLMAKEAVLRQTNDGRLSVVYTDNGVTDPAASGEVVFRMAEKTGEAEFTEAWKKMLGYLLNKAPKSADGILYHVLNAPEFWIDALYMAPPFLCVAGYPEEAVKQIEGYRKVLWNKKKQLFSHRWHDEKKMFPNEKFWGVGNGWAMACYARIIDTLPENMKTERNSLIKYATENIDGCLPFLRSDGLFHDIIDDNTSFVETNFAQMVAYTIYRGIKSGWLAKTYLEKAEKMRTAAHSKVDEHGYVQGVCGAPTFNSSGRASEGQAFFILMEAARKKLMS